MMSDMCDNLWTHLSYFVLSIQLRKTSSLRLPLDTELAPRASYGKSYFTHLNSTFKSLKTEQAFRSVVRWKTSWPLLLDSVMDWDGETMPKVWIDVLTRSCNRVVGFGLWSIEGPCFILQPRWCELAYWRWKTSVWNSSQESRSVILAFLSGQNSWLTPLWLVMLSHGRGRRKPLFKNRQVLRTWSPLVSSRDLCKWHQHLTFPPPLQWI